MCGFVGIVGAGLDEATLLELSAMLTHRGPDDAGVHVGPGYGLAARRLAVVDVAGGHQPLTSEDGLVVVVGNGEMFNAVELRRRLEALGHRFATRCDLEVVVHGYEEWGDDVVPRLRGMFAVAVGDERRGRVLLARDRFGMKPLSYAQSGGRVAFASELRPILAALPTLERRADPAALANVLDVGFVVGTRTAVADVSEVPPAHTVAIEGGAVQAPRRYWDLDDVAASGRGGRERDAAPDFALQLEEAVDAWLMSDVPIAALLSGGIDSAAVASLVTRHQPDLATFTVAFDVASHDEASMARATAEALGTTHHEIRCTFADFDRWPELMRHLETPQASATAIPLALLYGACRDAGFKVAMSGEGADELLGGYHWVQGDRQLRPLLCMPAPTRRALARSPLPISPAARRVLAAGHVDPLARYVDWQSVATVTQRVALRARLDPSASTSLAGHYSDVVGDRSADDVFRLLERETRLPRFVNHEVDRLSMAASVELRTPFLDHELWEWVARSGVALEGRKKLLRDAMRARVPDAARRRPKWGLAAPHAAWWRRPELPSWAADAMSPAALVETGYYRPDTVASLLGAHRDGTADTSRILTTVLTTQLFHAEVLQS